MYVRRRQPGFPKRARERGVVLLIALIFLVLLTLLAIGASSGSLLQQRMVAATRSAQLANMSGDTALRGAEWWLWSHPGGCQHPPADINASTGCVKYDPTSAAYGAGGAVTQFRTGNNAWLSTGVAYAGPDGSGFTEAADEMNVASPNVAENPRYIIEDMGRVKPSSGSQHESGISGTTSGTPNQPDDHTYRITARATGGNKNTVRVVESTFDANAKH